ncbi:hypothetical protein [Photorhabdus tasmaniensis]|uniref:Uncharacterized protein n=1 Tax=Photorhabdus tasmaniensis TaxID=1004159 RepID=A0ABX0GLJ2_9GAMM|nr:hypothetical protein [Photorhabdus tasmaniensis]NHB89716.1 hypothetical protein [Photorhabdus tasmaniensis]
MTIFTDIESAIEEARFLRHDTKHHHVVTQKRNGTLTVRQEVGINKESRLRKVYSTRYDCRIATVLPNCKK